MRTQSPGSSSSINAGINAGTNAGTNAGIINDGIAPSSEAPAPVVNPALLRGRSVGLLLLRFQEVLKSTATVMTTQSLILAVAERLSSEDTRGGLQTSIVYLQSLFSDSGFLEILKTNSRIRFDQSTRMWSYAFPFQGLESVDAFYLEVARRPHGLEITEELLEGSRNFGPWVEELLETRRVRAVRATTTAPARIRCKNFSGESGFACDLYEARANKCDSCASLLNVVLFPRHQYPVGLMSKPTISNLQEAKSIMARFHGNLKPTDDDVRELWSSVSMPTSGEVAVEAMKRYAGEGYAATAPPPTKAEARRTRRSRNRNSGEDGIVNRIVNSHVYSAESFTADLEKL